MKFTELLTANNLTEETVSAGLKAKIKRYHKIEGAIEEARKLLAEAKTERKQKDIGAEITRGEENLAALNDELVKGIQHNIDNAEAIEKKRKSLEEIRNKKKEKQDNPPAGDPPAGDPPAGDPPAGDPPAKDVDEPKKKSSGVAVVLGVAAALVAGFFGIKYLNRE